MCSPVSPKKAPPNSGTLGFQGFVQGVAPSPISVTHSVAWITTKAIPQRMVAIRKRTVFFTSPRRAAATPRTMVRLLERRTKVIREDFAMAGQISNGRGQSGVDIRTYA